MITTALELVSKSSRLHLFPLNLLEHALFSAFLPFRFLFSSLMPLRSPHSPLPTDRRLPLPHFLSTSSNTRLPILDTRETIDLYKFSVVTLFLHLKQTNLGHARINDHRSNTEKTFLFAHYEGLAIFFPEFNCIRKRRNFWR